MFVNFVDGDFLEVTQSMVLVNETCKINVMKVTSIKKRRLCGKTLVIGETSTGRRLATNKQIHYFVN